MKKYTMKQLTAMSTPDLVKIVHDMEWERRDFTENILQMVEGLPIKLYNMHGFTGNIVGEYSCYEEAIIAAIEFLNKHKKFGFVF